MWLTKLIVIVIFTLPMGQFAQGAAPVVTPETVVAVAPLSTPRVLALLGLGFVGLFVVARR